MSDTYGSFDELAAAEPIGDWNITSIDRPMSDVLVIAPHAGRIEPFTKALAMAIADQDYSLYCFEGLKQKSNSVLHITSHRFDEPTALSLAAQSSIVLGIHGCKGESAIYVGGRDKELVDSLTTTLVKGGFSASATGHQFPAVESNNICNRGKRRCGAQLEITLDLRKDAAMRAQIVALVRKSIADRLIALRLQEWKRSHSPFLP